MLGTLALWAGTALGGPAQWWAELLRYLPYPVYLAPAALALAAAAWIGWRWRVAGLGATALVLVAVMGLCWGRADAGGAPFRLMTWNAKAFDHNAGAERDERIALEIRAHDPDVLVLQDATSYGHADRPLPGALAQALRGRQLYAHGQYLVASRLPMRDCRVGAIPVPSEARDFVRCTITVAGADVDIVDVHLVSPRSGLNAVRHEGWDGGLDDWRDNYRERLQQAGTLQHTFAGHPRPLIIAGDLNASQASPVIRTLEAMGLRDAFASAGVGYGYTLGHALRTGFSFLRIDHILVGPSIGVRDCYAGGRDASEHRPVIADLLAQRR